MDGWCPERGPYQPDGAALPVAVGADAGAGDAAGSPPAGRAPAEHAARRVPVAAPGARRGRPLRPPRQHPPRRVRRRRRRRHHPLRRGALRGRDPVPARPHREPPRRAVPPRRARDAARRRRRLHRVHAPQHDGVRAPPRRRRQRRHSKRLLNGQHHRLGQGRGAAVVEGDHPERRGQRQGGGEAVQQHIQGRGAGAGERARRRAAAGERLLPAAVEHVEGEPDPHLLQEPLGVHVARRRHVPPCHDGHADRLHRAALLPEQGRRRRWRRGVGGAVSDVNGFVCNWNLEMVFGVLELGFSISRCLIRE
mgnify:CR=1 FL=1